MCSQVCNNLREIHVTDSMLKRGGELFDLVMEHHQIPKAEKQYFFGAHGVVCHYNQMQDK